MKSCFTCAFCIMEDHGYSNYTVEGTDVDCLHHAHPKFPMDRFYGEDPRLELDFAEKCAFYSEGEPVEIDVDQEELRYDPATKSYPKVSSGYATRPDVAALMDKYFDES